MTTCFVKVGNGKTRKSRIVIKSWNVALSDMAFNMNPMIAWNSWQSSWPSIPNAEVTDICHHILLKRHNIFNFWVVQKRNVVFCAQILFTHTHIHTNTDWCSNMLTINLCEESRGVLWGFFVCISESLKSHENIHW